MRFVSLSNPEDTVSFEGAIFNGAPQDSSSLYVPDHIPYLSDEAIEELPGADRFQIGRIMLSPFVKDEIADDDLEKIVHRAATFATPLVDVDGRHVLELFHGPTMAFKDVAAQYLGSFMSYYNEQHGRRSTVLVATSGDTGGAIAHGLADMPGIDVVVAYPKGRVSQLQQEQLRRVANNVHPVEVDGTFGDCLKLTDAAFANAELRRALNLTTANSISLGRLLPQTTYYASLSSQLEATAGRTRVPAGNLGNITSGLLTQLMGVPLPRFAIANNANNVLARYLASGQYEPRETIPTMSNAMDVDNPRNTPRFSWLFAGNIERMRGAVQAGWVTDKQTVLTINEVFAETGRVIDPHTAVAWYNSHRGDTIISTASPLKFAQEIYKATGIEVDDSSELARLRTRPERHVEIENCNEDFQEILEHLAA